MRIVIDAELCTGCETCVSSCPFGALEMKDGKAVINDFCNVCKGCIDACPVGAISEVADGDEFKPDTDLAHFKGVWIFAEQRHGKAAGVSYELLGIGRKLSEERNTTLSAVLFGADDSEARELIRWGAGKVYHAKDALFDTFNDEPYSQLMIRLIEQYKPEIVLAGATAIGRSFVPRVAGHIKTGLTADCTQLEIDKETGNLMQIRPAFGGNIMATILCPNYRPQMATVRPRVMKRGEYDVNRTGEIIPVKAEGLTCRTKVVTSVCEEGACKINLQDAEIIVSGGRGLGDAKGFELIRELAGLVGGVVGSSRAAVDEGWIPYRHQVGQTGKTVCPKIYIACGISGAVQHIVGMSSSDIIIAINKNPDAPIFNVATYGIVGDLYEVVPLLIKKIREAKG
ncbi:MAG TPA: electron transfer flavoprotein subunit alpha [Dissulfurispiraceae bacterium]|nr:electron transfer flavoprotein subunit alpha [Dissulfurispiraceae bacterium]